MLTVATKQITMETATIDSLLRVEQRLAGTRKKPLSSVSMVAPPMMQICKHPARKKEER
jgi:hypothetical protein